MQQRHQLMSEAPSLYIHLILMLNGCYRLRLKSTARAVEASQHHWDHMKCPDKSRVLLRLFCTYFYVTWITGSWSLLIETSLHLYGPHPITSCIHVLVLAMLICDEEQYYRVGEYTTKHRQYHRWKYITSIFKVL